MLLWCGACSIEDVIVLVGLSFSIQMVAQSFEKTDIPHITEQRNKQIEMSPQIKKVFERFTIIGEWFLFFAN
ncbi:hypothetical protein LQV63_17235 [Paenibacillus profundus]|uniref:Uncharacterized protein n=1 Tax=Paenibacillus profundus TaxID=1173085 RepID=A0ABS8YHJ7_9BACL|nr:hypothetical protein [Paenibacillus profundus]